MIWAVCVLQMDDFQDSLEAQKAEHGVPQTVSTAAGPEFLDEYGCVTIMGHPVSPRESPTPYMGKNGANWQHFVLSPLAFGGTTPKSYILLEFRGTGKGQMLPNGTWGLSTA